MKVKVLVVAVACWISGCSGQTTSSTLKAADSGRSESAGCPSSDFREFLLAYAGDIQLRDRYTRPIVVVTDWRNLDELEEGTFEVAKSDYKDFTLAARGDGFHHVDSVGDVDPVPVKVEISAEGNAYFVRYRYGMSEGNSWRFAEADGCWMLAEDPEPSDP